jgi:hypothetical protein
MSDVIACSACKATQSGQLCPGIVTVVESVCSNVHGMYYLYRKPFGYPALCNVLWTLTESTWDGFQCRTWIPITSGLPSVIICHPNFALDRTRYITYDVSCRPILNVSDVLLILKFRLKGSIQVECICCHNVSSPLDLRDFRDRRLHRVGSVAMGNQPVTGSLSANQTMKTIQHEDMKV